VFTTVRCFLLTVDPFVESYYSYESRLVASLSVLNTTNAAANSIKICTAWGKFIQLWAFGCNYSLHILFNMSLR